MVVERVRRLGFVPSYGTSYVALDISPKTSPDLSFPISKVKGLWNLLFFIF